MKKRLLILAALSCIGLTAFMAVRGSSGGQASAQLPPFVGTYRGVSPTDDAPLGMGEIEAKVTAGSINIRFATGSRVLEDQVPVADFRRLTDAEVTDMMQPGTGAAKNVVGFRPPKLEYPKFLFLLDPADGKCGGLAIKWGNDSDLRELAGPTLLFSPSALARGQYEQYIQAIEAEYWVGGVASLARGGKALYQPKEAQGLGDAGVDE